MAANGESPEMEKVNTHIVTLTRFLTEEQTKHKEATGDFTYVYPFLTDPLRSHHQNAPGSSG
jgi:hypothetical protein